ncbi:hypothetical protein BDN72DRAFT_883320 [Pluteus cervinus]|uniref:Uncharacterized protein n=1 Tax=Pluteus cervinus TaxID=181527 RepID=A0ACD3A6B2_9AGAR|nr:hypothetical protein BDN72DRAFT_883320 [Pluteus cervinus]
MTRTAAAHRVLAIPELLRSVFFSLPGLDNNYRTALVCRAWSEIALDVLWYEVDDICTLFNLLVPLTNLTDESSDQAFVRCPTPQDWTKFEKFSRRVKKLTVDSTTELPSTSVFDDIGRTRIRQEILPNLWSLKWCSNLSRGIVFLHPGIRDLVFKIDSEAPDQAKLFVQNACFFAQNITTLTIRVGRTGLSRDSLAVRCIEAELLTWFAELQSLRTLELPRFWLTSPVCEVLGLLPHISELEFDWEAGGYGDPLDTLTFNPIWDPGNPVIFPSLTMFGQSSPFSDGARFISSCQRSSHLINLTLTSQTLESPDAVRSALNIITTRCPNLSWLGLTCLTTPYRHPPKRGSHPRITLDTLLPLHNLKYLKGLEINHALPFALSNKDFRVLVKTWSKMDYLRFGHDPYPLAHDIVRIAEAPLAAPPVDQSRYPIMGLFKSLKSLRKYCPRLTGLSLFGIDDFTVQNDQPGVNQRITSPFPYLTALSFGTSSITSDKTVVAMALSKYLLPNVTFTIDRLWGHDQTSPYLTYLNLHPLFPLRGELSSSLQDLIDFADPTPFWPRDSQTITVNEPVGVRGVIDADMASEVVRRKALGQEISSLLHLLCEARQDERESAKRRYL